MRVHTCKNGNDCALCTETMQRDFEREIYRRADLEDAAMAAELTEPASPTQSIEKELAVEAK